MAAGQEAESSHLVYEQEPESKTEGHEASTCTIYSLTSSSKASSLKFPTTAAPPGTKCSNAQDDGIISSSTTTGGYVIFYQLLPALVHIQIYLFKSPHCLFFQWSSSEELSAPMEMCESSGFILSSVLSLLQPLDSGTHICSVSHLRACHDFSSVHPTSSSKPQQLHLHKMPGIWPSLVCG